MYLLLCCSLGVSTDQPAKQLHPAAWMARLADDGGPWPDSWPDVCTRFGCACLLEAGAGQAGLFVDYGEEAGMLT